MSYLGDDTKFVLVAAGLIFLWALLLGVWKYHQMKTSESHLAHPYVDIAHRAALLYSFAALLLATFVELSAWSAAVNAIAAGAVLFFFAAAIASYTVTGYTRRTENQQADPVPGQAAFMAALIVAEIGGFLVVFAGFLDAQVL
jgi:hypothetical protein